MGLSNAAKNLMLDALGATAGFASLHTANPGTTGASEIATGSYARKAITWNAAATGDLDSSNQPVFDVPSGTTAAYWGLWSSVVTGTFFGATGLNTPEYFAAAGTYTLTDADVTLS